MKPTMFVALASAIFVSASAYAHHSYAAYFTDRTVAIEGEIEQVHWANPHTLLTIAGRDGQTYTAEWVALGVLPRYHVAVGALQAGDTIVITACPSRDPATHRLALVKEIRRPSDGWIWALWANRS